MTTSTKYPRLQREMREMKARTTMCWMCRSPLNYFVLTNLPARIYFRSYLIQMKVKQHKFCNKNVIFSLSVAKLFCIAEVSSWATKILITTYRVSTIKIEKWATHSKSLSSAFVAVFNRFWDLLHSFYEGRMFWLMARMPRMARTLIVHPRF